MKIAITGAGIAGLTTAMYLHKDEHEVYIYEKAPAFKDQGYGLSVKTFGVDILKELGLFEALKNKGLPVSAFNIHNSGGRLLRKIPATVIEEMTGGAIPVSRGGLHQVLYEAVADVMPVIFDRQIVGISHLPEQEAVTFNDGSQEKFDLVIVAEGLRSTTRQLLCADQGWAPFDIAYMAASIDQPHAFAPGEAYTFRGVGRNISLFPVNQEQVVLQAYFRDSSQERLTKPAMRALLKNTFTGFTPQVTDLLHGFQTDAVFYDKVAMVQLPELYQRRVVFIGDAAHSTTFLSGMGASLGMLDGKLLAASLSAIPNTKNALQHFNAKMLPICRQFQHNAREAMKRELPGNTLQLSIANNVVRFLPFSTMIKSVNAKLTVERDMLTHIDQTT